MSQYKYFYRFVNVKPTGFYFQNEALGGEVGYMYINPTNKNIVLKPVSFFNPKGGIAELVGLRVIDAQGIMFMGEPSVVLNDIPHGAVRPGTIMMYVGKYEPPGWFFCNGKSISKTKYSNLFNIIGYIYTNDTVKNNSTLFTLPDFRYRTVKQLDNTPAVGGTTYTVLNNKGGKHEHILKKNEIADHLHDGTTPQHDVSHRHSYTITDFRTRYGPNVADPYGTERTVINAYTNINTGPAPFINSANSHTHPVTSLENGKVYKADDSGAFTTNSTFSIIPPSFYISFIIRT